MRVPLHIALILFFAFAAGCGRNEQQSARTVVYNCSANAAEIASLRNELPAFASRTGITLTLNPFTGQEKLYAMMAAGQAPDIFYTSGTMRDRLAAEGRILDLRPFAANDPFVSRLWPSIYATGMSVDSGLYSIPNWSFTLGVYFNKGLFEATGVPIPDTSWQWADLLSAARKLTRKKTAGGDPERFGIFIGSHFVESLEQMNGAGIVPNTLTAEINRRSAGAFAAYLQLMNEGVMPDLRRIQAMGMQAAQLLQEGKVAMLVEAVPHQMLIEGLTIRWGVAPLPRFPDSPPKYFRSASGGLSISASCRDPRAAWEALKWLVGEAPLYQPNPVLRDVDFVGGWESRYPQLVGNGFRETWELSLQHDGGDPRFFVRYSSWTSASILERLQPLLDRVWARELTVEGLMGAIPSVNERVERDLRDLLERGEIRPAFRKSIEISLEGMKRAAQR